ncbi:hypothetical protein [Ruminococcus sp.]|nr:hypothetical protein [Ruminococcus sp.]MBQ8967256.1 hypothetical protein [Ruminococcus sp.]
MKGKFLMRTLSAAAALLLAAGSAPAQPLAQLFNSSVISASAESSL